MKSRTRQESTMRLRIAKGMILLLLALFVAIWGLMAERTLRGLNGSLDESLKSLIDFAASQVVREKGSVLLKEDVENFLSSWTPGVEEFYLEVRSLDDGQVLRRSTYLANDDNLLEGKSFDDILESAGDKGWNGSAGGDPIRCMAAKVSWPVGSEGQADGKTEDVLFIAGVERLEVDRRFKEIMKRSGIGLGVTLLIAVLGVWIVVSRATRPLAGLAEDVATITPENIRDVRVPSDPQLALLARQLNHSLQAVARSMEREKRFSSDVAHELLTPVGGLRTELEVALLKKRGAEDLRITVQNSKSMVMEIQALVEDLLELGRLENGTGKVDWSEIKLSESVDAAWSDQELSARSRGIVFENRIDTHVRVRAGEQFLNLVLKNLLSNVVRYTPSDGKAWVECGETDQHLVLQIMNEVETTPPHLCEHAFERFWRGDASRTKGNLRGRHGIGLGLSVAHSAAHAMGGELEIEVHQGPTVCLLLRLKRA